MKDLRVIYLVGMIMLILNVANLFAQAPDTLWTKTYGGGDDDEGFSTCQTADDGFIIVGRTYGTAQYDVYLIKTDENGGTLWTKTYGGAGNELGYHVQQTSDNGYIIVGGTNSFGSGWDIYLIKTDSLGDTLWTRTYENGSTGYSVQQTSDSGYIIGGKRGGSVGDACLIKTDENGDTLWTQIYGGAQDDACYWVRETTDGGYIAIGETRSFGAGYYDVYVLKTDINGDTLWAKTYGTAEDEQGWSVQQTFDHGYIISGFTGPYLMASDIYLIKIDSIGNLLWTKTYGGAADEKGRQVVQTSDTGYIVTGHTTSFGAGAYDVYVVRTDSLGDSLWTKTYGGTNNERAWSVQQTVDTGYIITGGTYSFGTAGSQDVWLIKTEPEPVGIAEDQIANPLLADLKIYPNPFRKSTVISYSSLVINDQLPVTNDLQCPALRIYDVSGRLVKDFSCTTSYAHRPTHIIWDGTDTKGEKVNTGIYFLKAKGLNRPQKVVFLR
jgi:hypothetical protein